MIVATKIAFRHWFSVGLGGSVSFIVCVVGLEFIELIARAAGFT